jgi:hypothetical protein
MMARGTKGSKQRPDTLMQGRTSPTRRSLLATHGRTIHLGHLRPTRPKRHVPVCPLCPESGLHKSRCDPPLSAKSGCEQLQQSSRLLYLLVVIASNVGGRARPSALAVPALTTISNLVGRWMGGRSPTGNLHLRSRGSEHAVAVGTLRCRHLFLHYVPMLCDLAMSDAKYIWPPSV